MPAPGTYIVCSGSTVATSTGPVIELTAPNIALINTQLSCGNEVRVLSQDGTTLVQYRRPYLATTCATSSTNTVYTPIGTWSSTSTTSTTSTTWFGGDTNWTTIISAGSQQAVKQRSIWLRKRIDSARASIKRTLRLIANFGMEEDVRIFLGGGEIQIAHPESMFKFVLRKRSHSNLISATHSPTHMIPYELDLRTKCDLHVASLCVIMDKTPILDQILALAMYIKTGNEEEILHKANFSRLLGDRELRQVLALESPILETKLLRHAR